MDYILKQPEGRLQSSTPIDSIANVLASPLITLTVTYMRRVHYPVHVKNEKWCIVLGLAEYHVILHTFLLINLFYSIGFN